MNKTDSKSSFDVVIIGAGINGAGVARDAAMRGLKVLLLDKGDIASGTSSASTRLIHGGLRYLEHGEFGLVRESLLERETLFRIAPHLVKVLAFVLPIYKHSSRGRLKIHVGLFAYDFLSQGKSLAKHRMLSGAEMSRHAPGLETNELVGGALYYDAQVEYAERLVLENVSSAVELGATVETYNQVRNIRNKDGRVVVEYLSTLTNEAHEVSGSFVVNAAGPWVDELLGTSGARAKLIGGTKGSHIVVSHFRGAPQTAMYVEAEADHRPFFIIPWNGHYLIGTTDVRYEGSPDKVSIDEGEVEYLLRETNRLFPAARLSHSSILFTFSGVRPLAYSTAKDEQSITRRHFLRESSAIAGLVSIVGGKLTTYRAIAEETVDLIAKRIGLNVARSETASNALPGGQGFSMFAERFRRESWFDEKTTERLLALYGSQALKVAELTHSDPSLACVIDEESGGIAAEAVFAFTDEFAQTLSDVLLRRTMWAFNSKGGLDVVDNVARVCATRFGWTPERVATEIDRFKHEMATSHGRRLTSGGKAAT